MVSAECHRLPSTEVYCVSPVIQYSVSMVLMGLAHYISIDAFKTGDSMQGNFLVFFIYNMGSNEAD